MTERILIRSTNWVGDAVMSLAAIREIRRLFPDAWITIFAREWVSGVFVGQDLADDVLSFDSEKSTLRWLPKLRSYHRAILLQNAFRSALTAFLARIPERCGYRTDYRGFLLTRSAVPRIRERRRHQIYYYLDLLAQTGLSEVHYLEEPHFQPDISLRTTPAGEKGAEQLLDLHEVPAEAALVGFNPGAYFGSAKRWSTSRYAQLADRLIERSGCRVLIFGSAGEKKIAEEIRSKMTRRPDILSGETDLPSLMALMKRCRLFITNDSGPMHLAAALDLPQIALFGSTDEVATGPFSSRAQVIHKHVECSPCFRRECPIDLRCFQNISVDEVLERAEKILP